MYSFTIGLRFLAETSSTWKERALPFRSTKASSADLLSGSAVLPIVIATGPNEPQT